MQSGIHNTRFNTRLGLRKLHHQLSRGELRKDAVELVERRGGVDKPAIPNIKKKNKSNNRWNAERENDERT